MRLKMLNLTRSLAIAAGFLVAPVAGFAGTPMTYTDGERALFQIEVPDFWSVRTGGLRDLTAPDAENFRDVSRIFGLTPETHEGIWVGFVSPHGVASLADARDYLTDIGQFLVKDAQVETSRSRRIAGLPAQTFSGTGRRGGKPLEFTAITIDMPNGRVAVSVVVFEAGSDVDIINDINEMMASFKVVR
ncbi:MAG: hypothetical protein R8G34_22375 [Paracoccaceae bacterium]|nr:hypothetical protein [Paracoccaceae bacterium]